MFQDKSLALPPPLVIPGRSFSWLFRLGVLSPEGEIEGVARVIFKFGS